MTNMTTLYYTRTPAPGVMAFLILLKHSLLFINMYSLCLLVVLENKFSNVINQWNNTILYIFFLEKDIGHHMEYLWLRNVLPSLNLVPEKTWNVKKLQADARTNNGQQATSRAHSGKLIIKQYWYKSLNHKVKSLFVCFLGAITGEGLQILTYTRHSWSLSSEGSFACHTECDTGHPFIMVISEDLCHSYLLLLPSV